MNTGRDNRFEDFFADDLYVNLKNLLYNYLLRKRAIKKCMQGVQEGLVLEVGSGMSPMVIGSDRVVYSELSFRAVQTLKRFQERGAFVVADAAHLPFSESSFSLVICSEVLEHLPEDRPALKDMAEVLKTGGSLILTFPHRHGYFAQDDRFVGHFRRYELPEMEECLKEVGLKAVDIWKVLGPLEKATMVAVVWAVSRLQCLKGARGDHKKVIATRRIVTSFFKWFNRLYCVPVWLDARLFPRSLATVLLVRAVKG
ncbi:MAG: class I SAM-dependent methyltransferase [Proteobacteria bacterium]|nr:class I SAM-dependent methyltransferase [Pseudomonadota bacterium]MBU3931274.1 class I SAM-dependent methyltransferase [Pseudomonadota bacterium]